MTKKRLLLLLLIIIPIEIFCQTVKFNYDSNGNRIGRTLIPLQLKSATISFPIQEHEKLTLAENQKETIIEGEISVKIYPNPTKGILKIEIYNLPTEVIPSLSLYNLSGLEIVNITNLNPIYNLDLSSYSDGIYILRLVINNKVTNWKIIKN